jgi:pimeloyl-ACP methyl ester carboxylesterase
MPRVLRCSLQAGFLMLFCAACLAAPRLPAPKKIPTAPASIALTKALRVGSLMLQACRSAQAYCGSVERSLDPSGTVAGTIKIGFEFYPHTDNAQLPLEPIVAEEGGPGYGSTGSRAGYLDLFAPLHDRRDILLVDNRGTGKSQALDCPLAQQEPNPQFAGIRACGAQLGNAAYLYGSGLAADDLAAVLDALSIPMINLYGDSYGTFFSQTFAGRHPERLRSLILDSAYPPVGQSPWYPEIATTAHFAFNAACERSATCRGLPGRSADRIEKLAESLRSHPFTGYAHDGNGVLRRTVADATTLDYLMVSNATTSVVYRELDPAARAYLEDGDAAPILRLLAENLSSGQAGGSLPASYSQALFIAVSCSDYPQIYDMTLPVEIRKLQRDQVFAAEDRTHPNLYAPFTIEEFSRIQLDTSVLDLCLEWPAPIVAPYPPGHPVPPNAQFTKAPTLVLSGDLDSLTPAKQGKHSAELFENGRQIVVPNSFHVTAVGDEDSCASGIAQRFVRDLDAGDTSCTSHIAEVHLVPRFVSTAAQLDAAVPTPGNQGTDADLHVAAASAYTLGDVLARWWVNYSGNSVGLRGGHFSYRSSGHLTRFRMHKTKWVSDLEVSGRMNWDYNYPGSVAAHITLGGAATEIGHLVITWNSRMPAAQATVTGKIGNRPIAATMYAP